jgi:hypothetical protein
VILTAVQQYNDSTITANLLPHYALSNSYPSTCPSPTEILLYLDVYLVFSCIASLTVGAKPVRASLSHNRFLSLNFISDHQQYLPWISIFGSLIIHFCATAVTADVLVARNDGTTTEPALGLMFLVWFSRPLATALVTWLSIADWRAYHENAREVAIVDSLYSFVNVYLFFSVARITNFSPSDMPTPARLARAGSALWLLALILSIGILAWYMFEARGWMNGRKSAIFQFLPWIWISLDWLRFLGCWLLWAGLLLSDETGFCPRHRALVGVTIIWLFVPFVDCLWRGLATYKQEDSAEAESLIQM